MPRRYAENTENLDFFITILMPDKKKKKFRFVRTCGMPVLMCKVRSLLFLTQEALIISFRILLVKKFEFTKQLINYGFNIVCIYVLFFF